MSMRRTLSASTLGFAALLLPPPPASATFIEPPFPNRVAGSDVVVVARVVGIEAKRVNALAPYPRSDKQMEYQIVRLKVEDAVLGTKDGTEVRLGVLMVTQLDGRGARLVPLMKLAVGQQVLALLVKHPDENFYVPCPVAGTNVIDKKAANFAKNLAEAKKLAKLLKDPEKGLTSKDAGERLLTAALLINRYRGEKLGKTKTEPIDATESRLILEALAAADWKRELGQDGFADPLSLFYQMGGASKDSGYTPPKDFKDVPESAKKWVKDNVSSFRIQRFVPDKGEKKDERK
jgi:hypothetical protein